MKIGFQDQLSLNAGQKYCRMLQGEHSEILSTFIKLPLSLRFLFVYFWVAVLHRFYTGFTVVQIKQTLPQGIMIWSVIHDCGISWLYSLVFHQWTDICKRRGKISIYWHSLNFIIFVCTCSGVYIVFCVLFSFAIILLRERELAVLTHYTIIMPFDAFANEQMLYFP